MNTVYSILIFLFLSNLAFGQKYVILADNLIDIRSGRVIENPVIVILDNKIIDVNHIISQEVPEPVEGHWRTPSPSYFQTLREAPFGR